MERSDNVEHRTSEARYGAKGLKGKPRDAHFAPYFQGSILAILSAPVCPGREVNISLPLEGSGTPPLPVAEMGGVEEAGETSNANGSEQSDD